MDNSNDDPTSELMQMVSRYSQIAGVKHSSNRFLRS